MRLLLLLPCIPLFLIGTAQEYFQQEVNYTIFVSLDDEKHILRGFEEFHYTNNSTNVLDTIWMHIWPNAYKNNTTALAEQFIKNADLRFYFSEEDERGYIDSLNFKVDGQTVIWQHDEEHIDICYLVLNTPLQPRSKITVTTPFKVKIPDGKFSRLGHIGQSYMITQWYPKPAVYDRDGWHVMPYLNQGEFYSEFGSFDVSITLPDNYKLAATGDRQDAIKEEHLLNELAETTANKEEFNSGLTFPPSSKTTKTIRFSQENVHDFAWFADKRWNALTGTVALPYSKRTVQLWAFFTDAEAHLWMNSIEYLRDAVYYYSLWNGDYPYNHCTAVDGTIAAGGGMEYPNITVIGYSGDSLSLETVIMHEVGHNWFYGILGSNERDHAWMDEGINSFNEMRYLRTKYPNVNLLESYLGLPEVMLEFLNLNDKGPEFLYRMGYTLNASRGYDQPNDFPSEHYTSINYGTMVYMKTAVAFNYLFNYLGDSIFDACMHEYYDRWHFKHPMPQDIEDVFEEVTGKDLDWFFKDLLTTTGKVDYSISKVKYLKTRPATFSMKIKNVGDIASPVLIKTYLDSIWVSGNWKDTTIIVGTGIDNQFTIDQYHFTTDINTANNAIRSRGILKRWNWPKLKFIAGWDEEDRSSVFWTPIIGWNQYNRFMIGVGLYNSIIPQKRFEFAWVPMYSFETNSMTGSGFVGYNWFPKKVFHTIRASYNWNSYNINYKTEQLNSWYTKAELRVDFHLRDKYLADNKNQYLSIWAAGISEMNDYRTYTYESGFGVDADGYDDLFAGIDYSYVNDHVLHPFTAMAKFEYGNNGETFTPNGVIPGEFGVWSPSHYGKLSGELTYGVLYNEHRKYLNLRLFAGYFLWNESESARYNWQMDGQAGAKDYLYDEIFLGRNETNPAALAQQRIFNHGAFKTAMLSGHSNDWLVALNIDADVPFPLPIVLFADFGAYPFYINGEPATGTLYDAGISFVLLDGNFRLNLPLFFSEEIADEYETRDIGFGERVTFNLTLKELNPFKLVKKIPY